MSDALTPDRSSRRTGRSQLAKRSHDPLGDELVRRALAFNDDIVKEAGEVLQRGMRGQLPGSDAREQRLCAQAIRAERVPSASSLPTSTPRVEVRIAAFAQLAPSATPEVWRNGHTSSDGGT